jgi:Cysteine-rich domain
VLRDLLFLYPAYAVMAASAWAQVEVPLASLKLDQVVELKGDTHHVQGVAVDGEWLWVTSVERETPKAGWHTISEGLEAGRSSAAHRAPFGIPGPACCGPAFSGCASNVVFHNPCYLGRYRNVFEEPRKVIERSAKVIDPPRARSRSFCCRAGGGLFFLGEEEGKRVNVERAEELVRTGAETIGVACPFCRSMFKDALGESQGAPKLLDIAQIAAAKLR